jgi:hypothetical protein
MSTESFGNLSFKNKENLKKSKTCGCYYCGAIYSPKQIKEYCDRGRTAICPFCGIDSVLPSCEVELTKELLEEGYKRWFSVSI